MIRLGNKPMKKNVSIEIPFISQVSYYIKQIKLDCKELEQHRKSLYNEISFAENKKLTLENNQRNNCQEQQHSSSVEVV